jgi:hypothetical protein
MIAPFFAAQAARGWSETRQGLLGWRDDADVTLRRRCNDNAATVSPVALRTQQLVNSMLAPASDRQAYDSIRLFPIYRSIIQNFRIGIDHYANQNYIPSQPAPP